MLYIQANHRLLNSSYSYLSFTEFQPSLASMIFIIFFIESWICSAEGKGKLQYVCFTTSVNTESNMPSICSFFNMNSLLIYLILEDYLYLSYIETPSITAQYFLSQIHIFFHKCAVFFAYNEKRRKIRSIKSNLQSFCEIW